MIPLHPTNYQHRCIFDLEGSFNNCNEQQLVATNQTIAVADTPTKMIQLHTNKMAVEDLYSCSDDTDTTACTSSREDTSTLSGSLSSYLNNWEFNNELDPLDDSYYSALSTSSHYHDIGSLVGRSYRDDKTSESLQPLELTHEIQHMLSNESSSSSSDTKIDNYFEQPSEYTEDQQEDDYSPIDLECRAKMMDWSFRVVSFSFPHNDYPTTTPKYKRKRKHSIQALQIVSHAFTLVDRYATTHQYRIDGRVMDRQEYKLVCMICLHITAKTSSLYGLNSRDADNIIENNDIGQGGNNLCCHNTPDTASDSDDSDIAQSQRDFQQRRPPFTILSLPGLLALSSNEYTISQLISVELNILQALQWKGILLGTGGTVVDWCLILLNLLAEDMCSKVFKSIQDDTLISIEYFMDKAVILGSGVKPNSLIALALVIHALGANSDRSCYCNIKKRQLLNGFPYQEEEVFEVIKMHLSSC